MSISPINFQSNPYAAKKSSHVQAANLNNVRSSQPSFQAELVMDAADWASIKNVFPEFFAYLEKNSQIKNQIVEGFKELAANAKCKTIRVYADKMTKEQLAATKANSQIDICDKTGRQLGPNGHYLYAVDENGNSERIGYAGTEDIQEPSPINIKRMMNSVISTLACFSR